MGPVQAAAYLRVSSEQQDVDLQRGAIERAALARGDEIAVWFEEKQSRERDGVELRRVHSEIAGGRVRKLYVFALDRLGEGVFRITKQFLQFRHYGCEVVTCADGFDPSGPAGDMLVAIFAWVSEQERRRMRQRMGAARVEAEKSGKRWGRPRRVDPTTLAAARKLRDVDKLSLRVIAARLKVPKATLLRALHGQGHYAIKK